MTGGAPGPCLDAEQAMSFVLQDGSAPSGGGSWTAAGGRLAVERHLDDCGRCRRLVAEAASVSRGADPATPEPVRSLPLGERVLGRYQIRRFISRGGMGEVYEAFDELMGEPVALKTLLPTALDSERSAQQFLDEVRLARRVTHSNVCRILEFGIHGRGRGEALPFLTMELLQGETVAERLRRVGRLDVASSRRILGAVAEALTAIHRAGIVHRDLKTENIILVTTPAGGERVVVMDFGLARGLAGDLLRGWSTDGSVAGTLDYMAPEQLEGRPPTPAFDIYAAGLVAFEMLTGERVFGGGSPLAGACRRLQETARSPSSLVRDLHPAWDLVVGRCLERDPARRFPSAAQLMAALDRGLAGPPRRFRRGAWLPLLLALLMGGAGAGGAQRAATTALGHIPDAGHPGADLRYSFESTAQGWKDLRYEYYRSGVTEVRPSTERAFEGRHSLAVDINTTATFTTPTVGIYEEHHERLPPGAVISYWLWIPAGAGLEALQPYVLYHRRGEAEPVWAGADPLIPASALPPGRWNRVTLQVPDDVDRRGVIEVGMEWRTRGAQRFTLYLDAVSW
jgi:hypothetical protein